MSEPAPPANPPGTTAAPEPGVHRLVDMLVEEVSLVDRPANKQRFLVVKRESEMPKKTEEKTPAAGAGGASADPKKPKGSKPKGAPAASRASEQKAKKPSPPKAPADDEEDEEDEPKPGKSSKAFPPKTDLEDEEDDDQEEEPDAEDTPAGRKPPKKRARKDELPEGGGPPGAGPPEDDAPDDDETPLGIALAALDSLTQAVELLSDAPDDGGPLAAVAQDIRNAADAIASAAGMEAEEEEEEESEERGEQANVDKLVSTIQAMLTRIESLTQALSASTRTPAAAPTTTTTTATQAPPDLAGTLAEVAQSMKSLDSSVKAQAARLETLEKRAGVPNSQPPGERVTKGEPEDLSWPMDMNRPRDRASVDKSVSFYSGERE